MKHCKHDQQEIVIKKGEHQHSASMKNHAVHTDQTLAETVPQVTSAGNSKDLKYTDRGKHQTCFGEAHTQFVGQMRNQMH